MQLGPWRSRTAAQFWPGSWLQLFHPIDDAVDIRPGPADRRVDREEQGRRGSFNGPSLAGEGVVVVDPGHRTIADDSVDGRYLELGLEGDRRKLNDGQRRDIQ